MELRKHLNPRIVFIGLYVVTFLLYIIYGLMPAEAVDAYVSDALLSVPSIGLESDVTKLEVTKDGLPTPDTIVGSYSRAKNKVFLIGHSSTVFKDLEKVKIGEILSYKNKVYRIQKLEFSLKEAVNMNEILKAEDQDTIVIMTCAGKSIGSNDATHRFIVTAVAE